MVHDGRVFGWELPDVEDDAVEEAMILLERELTGKPGFAAGGVRNIDIASGGNVRKRKWTGGSEGGGQRARTDGDFRMSGGLG